MKIGGSVEPQLLPTSRPVPCNFKAQFFLLPSSPSNTLALPFYHNTCEERLLVSRRPDRAGTRLNLSFQSYRVGLDNITDTFTQAFSGRLDVID